MTGCGEVKEDSLFVNCLRHRLGLEISWQGNTVMCRGHVVIVEVQ